MDSEKELYEIKFTEDSVEEIREIYKYISETLIAENTAKKWMKKIKDVIMNLAYSPRLYMKIDKKDRRKRYFRRIVIDNYVILYCIDEDEKIVYVSHMYYGRKNYL